MYQQVYDPVGDSLGLTAIAIVVRGVLGKMMIMCVLVYLHSTPVLSWMVV